MNGLPTFESIKEELLETGDNNACAAIAISIVTGIPYNFVSEAFAEAGRKFRENAPNDVIMKAIDNMGLKLMMTSIDARNIRDAEKELQAKGRGFRIIVDSIDHWAAFDGEKIDDFTRDSDLETTGNIFFIVKK